MSWAPCPKIRSTFYGIALALLAVGASAQEPAEPEREPKLRTGQLIRVAGDVTGPSGVPLPDLSILFEATGPDFKLRSLSRERKDAVVVPTTTDAQGRFALDWSWLGGYDRFELAVAVPVTRGDRPGFEVLQRWDVTEPVRRGGPVHVSLPFEDATTADWLLRFSDGRASNDERRAFGELGLPEKIDGPDPVLGEVSWWYFSTGKVYRFKDGNLVQVFAFDPIAEP